jgi:hypothetical protein
MTEEYEAMSAACAVQVPTRIHRVVGPWVNPQV